MVSNIFRFYLVSNLDRFFHLKNTLLSTIPKRSYTTHVFFILSFCSYANALKRHTLDNQCDIRVGTIAEWLTLQAMVWVTRVRIHSIPKGFFLLEKILDVVGMTLVAKSGFVVIVSEAVCGDCVGRLMYLVRWWHSSDSLLIVTLHTTLIQPRYKNTDSHTSTVKIGPSTLSIHTRRVLKFIGRKHGEEPTEVCFAKKNMLVDRYWYGVQFTNISPIDHVLLSTICP